jgi:ABC-type multidrug transport system fused ATPase/permease subunit
MELDHLTEEEDSSYRFKPLSFQFLKSHEWDGVSDDIKWIWPWFKPLKKKFLFGFFFFIVTTLIAVIIPRYIAYIIDVGIVQKSSSFHLMLIVFASLVALKIVCDIAYKWIVTKNGQTLTKSFRNDIFLTLHNFPVSFFDKNPSGRLISRCVNDVTNLSAFFTSNFFTVISDLLIILGSLIAIITLSPSIALVTIMMILPLAIFMLNVSQSQMRWGRSLRNLLSRMSSHTAETMNNLSVLHSQPFAPKWIRRHEKLQTIFTAMTTRNIYIWGSFSSLHVIVMGVTYSLVIILSVHYLKNNQLTVGQFIAIMTYVSLIFGPFFEISEKLNTMLTALGSVKRIRMILPYKINPSIPVEVDSAQAPPSGDIVFQDIVFGYSDFNKLFNGLNLVIPENQVTALVGRTGSGKSSMAQLLLSLYPTQSGDIFWGNESLVKMHPERRSKWISYISQDLFLFTDSIRENLRLYNTEIDDRGIQTHLERIGLWKKISSLPEGLDTIVRSETLPLSQGERQLLLLCRALLQNARLLIFDEATASLDQLTEIQWLEHIQDIFKDRTTLFIAHRLETLKLASRVIVLDQGKVHKVFDKPRGQSVREEDLK